MPLPRTLRMALMGAMLAGPLSLAVAQEGVPSVSYVWKNVKVGAGGFIPGIVFSRAEKGLAYLRSDMGGAYRWDDAAQTWVPMHDHFAESSYFGTESVAPDPVDPDVVYLAAGMYRSDPAAILRSRDRGQTWEVFPVPFRMGGNEDGRGLGERLTVDPNDTRILYFASRHDGLQRSIDYGETWQKVASFPLPGRGLPERGQPTHGGLSFVVFDPASSAPGSATRTIFVGSSDEGDRGLFRSDDAGETWRRVEGGPPSDWLPAKAEIDDRGVLYLTYANNIGPNGVTDGGVWKLDTRHSGGGGEAWTDITPDKRENRPKGGYMGISLDRQSPGESPGGGVLGVTTMNRWWPADTVWRSADGGATWHDIHTVGSTRDVSATPFLRWGREEAKIGWWMAAFAIDPFDSDHAAYATGATVFATKDFSSVTEEQTTHWYPWVEGIEQTAIITLLSPGAGAPLLSGFGDLGGFVHEDLDVSPPQGMYDNPMFGNTNTLFDAGMAPHVIVRSGRPNGEQSPIAWSEDGGRSWQPLPLPAIEEPPLEPGQRRRPPRPALLVSADGVAFMALTMPQHVTRDRGQTWSPVEGLPETALPVADRVNPAKFHAIDFATGQVLTSTDGGATFTSAPTQGLPDDISGDARRGTESPWPLHATPGMEDDLWFVSKHGLFHSADGGAAWERVDGGVQVEILSFGKAPPGRDYPALFAIGRRGDLRAVWRSDDRGASWVRINDDRHQWGTRFRCIAGDPRVFGRVYVGTDGRGIVYGTPAE